MIIGADTTPQLWVEQLWQSFDISVDMVKEWLRVSDDGRDIDAVLANISLTTAESLLRNYMVECDSLGCRSSKEDIDTVRSLMRLKYELRG